MRLVVVVQVTRLQKDFRGAVWLKQWYGLLHSEDPDIAAVVAWGRDAVPEGACSAAGDLNLLRNAIGVNTRASRRASFSKGLSGQRYHLNAL